MALPKLIPNWFTLLSTTTPSATFKLHPALIIENHISKVVAPVGKGKLQSLLLIDITYELAVGTSSKCAPHRCSATKYGMKVECVNKAR